MQEDYFYTQRPPIKPGLLGAYLKLGSAIAVGAAMALGIYFFILQNPTQGQTQAGANNPPPAPAPALCVCPSCGLTVHKPANLDCEEIRCPNSGHKMVPAVAINGQNGATPVALTQNQAETMAEQGIVTPGPLSQNQQETLAEQGITPGGPKPLPPLPATPPPPAPRANAQTNPQLAAMTPPATGPANGGGSPTCVCPACGKTTPRNPGFSCAQVPCPSCRTGMTNALMVGRTPNNNTARPIVLAATQPGTGTTGTCPLHNHTGAGQVGAGTGQTGGGMHQMGGGMHQMGGGMHQMGGGMHQMGGGGVHQMHPGLHQSLGAQPGTGLVQLQTAPATGTGGNAAANAQITYSNTVQGIVEKNCYRCHSGPFRNLTTYSRIKGYADNGLLMMMVQPGGPMSRFLSANEAHQIMAWIKAGAPQ